MIPVYALNCKMIFLGSQGYIVSLTVCILSAYALNFMMISQQTPELFIILIEMC